MSIKANIALSLAIVLGTATAALAAPPKHTVRHHQPGVVLQVPGSAYQAYGSARDAEGAGSRDFGYTPNTPGYDPYNRQQRVCIGGSCAPNWNSNY